MRFAFDPVVAVLLLLAAGLYVRAVRIVGRRRLSVSRGQQACWWIGMALLAIGLLGPPDAYDGDLLSAHMAQHLLIGDVAAPFLLVGLRAPLLLFYLPRPALVALAHQHWLRRVFRVLRRPLVALPLYVLTIYAWHLSVLFEGALRHPLLHALQHECFIAANLLLWWPVIEPLRRRMGGQLWKIGYIFAARMSTMFLGMMFVFTRTVLYESSYGSGPREGLSALSDQQTAGGTMMTLDIVIMAIATCWFFWSASKTYDEEERNANGGAARVPRVSGTPT
ncbi:MAG TPA: cytochrome c oxidase assembly protein [Conexibacter sp.]|nr:cytochrome c oxidase assembly protein [Conexibacter sp.]